MQTGGYRSKENRKEYQPGKPVLSVITVVYQAEKLLERTMESVLNQDYPNIEYIIVDGVSQDGTLEIIRRYDDRVAVWISEKDQGIYDAMNKGQNLATGDYLLFLNAGDEFFDPQVCTKIFTDFPEADAYYGETEIISEEGVLLGRRRLNIPEKLSWKSLQYGMVVCHQSFIVRRTLALPYNTEYRISADIDWVINSLKKGGTFINTGIYISKFLEGGMSNQQMKRGLIERYHILRHHFGFIPNLLNHVYITFRLVGHLLSGKKI